MDALDIVGSSVNSQTGEDCEERVEKFAKAAPLFV